jgi:excisionase family DNA binding protein
MERYLAPAEAASYLGKTRKALYHLVQRRVVPFIRVGRRLTFDRLALDRWLAGHKVDATGGLRPNSDRSDRSR